MKIEDAAWLREQKSGIIHPPKSLEALNRQVEGELEALNRRVEGELEALNRRVDDFISRRERCLLAELDSVRQDRELFETAIREALEAAGGRWSEWGDRALSVAEILEKALSTARRTK